MKLFRFEKWFFDILTENREYFIFFHTLTEFLGFRVCYIEMDMGRFKDTGKIPEFQLTNAKLSLRLKSGDSLVTDRGSISIDRDFSYFDLTLEDLKIELEIKPELLLVPEPGGMLIKRSRRQILNWRPLFLKYLVSGRIRQGVNEFTISDSGYADYVQSTINPVKVPVYNLYWGRLHSDRFDLTYSFAEGSGGTEKWTTMILQMDNESRQIDLLKLRPGEKQFHKEPGITCPASYRIEAADDSTRVSIEVRHIKPAIVSAFTDNPEKLGKLRRTILKKLAREPRGIKFFSSATCEITLKGKTKTVEDQLMIDEFVVFS